jgi:hypothetical protein
MLQLRALSRACPGLLEGVTTAVEDGVEPTLKILRTAPRAERPRWYVEVGSQVLVLDAEDQAAMAAAVPILIVDLLDDLRSELSPLFEDGTMDEGINMIFPLGARVRGGRPS